jgi:hypothetical protein
LLLLLAEPQRLRVLFVVPVLGLRWSVSGTVVAVELVLAEGDVGGWKLAEEHSPRTRHRWRTSMEKPEGPVAAAAVVAGAGTVVEGGEETETSPRKDEEASRSSRQHCVLLI